MFLGTLDPDDSPGHGYGETATPATLPITTSLPARGSVGILRASTRLIAAIPVPIRNTAAGDTSHTSPNAAGIKSLWLFLMLHLRYRPRQAQ